MAKRVNKRFLVILTVVVAMLGVAAFAAQKLLNKKDPAKYVALGDKAMEAGDLPRARDQYRIAYSADPTNKETLVKLGDALERMAGEDLENLINARKAWATALQIDPNYAPALQRVLDTEWDEMETGPVRPELYQHVRETAEKLAAADPSAAPRAKSRAYRAVVRQWTRGIVTPAAEVDRAVAGMAELAKQQPADAELPAAIAQVKLTRAGELARTAGRRDEGAKLAEEAAAWMDAALKGQEQNAAMQFRAAHVYAAAASYFMAPDETARREALAGKSKAALQAAFDRAKPEDEEYVDIHLTAAAQAQAANDPKNPAERILENLRRLKPNDQRVRLGYAQLVGRSGDPAKRDAAIALLNEPLASDPESTRGIRAFRQKLRNVDTIHARTALQLAAYGALTDAGRRRQLMAEMRESVKKLEGLVRGDDPRLLNLRGTLELLDGRPVEAADLLERAARQMSPQTIDYYDVKYRLAAVYADLGQTGQARKHLEEVVQRLPDQPAGRVLMARVLLQENDLDAAAEHVRRLKELAPASPEVQRLEISLAERRAPGSAAAQVSQMPEGTRVEKLRKAQYLLAVKQAEPGEKLLQGLIAADPKDLEAVFLLAQYYAGANQTDKAAAVVEQALKADPGNKALADALTQLRTKSPEDLYNYQKSRIAAVADEFQRELLSYDLERQFNHRDEAARHLQRAQALKPEDTAVVVRQFDWASSAGRWDEAAALVDKLAKANADEIGGRLYRFRLAFARGDYAAAEQAAREMTQLRSNFSQGHAALGQALHAQRKYREAIEAYRAALDKKPLDYDSLRGLIACLYLLNVPDEARQAIAEARQRFPNDRTFAEMALGHELEYGDADKVVAEREKQWKQAPDSADNALALAAAYQQAVEKKYLTGPNANAKAAELRAKARDVLAAALAKRPDDARLVASLAEVLQWLGDANGARQAVDAFAARPEQQGKPTARLIRADYFNRARQPESAEAEMREALKVADKAAALEIRQRLVNSLSQRGRADEALAVLREAGEVPPESRLFRQQVQLLVNLGRYDDARKAVDQALAKAPNSTELLNVRTAVLLEAGQVAEAEQNAEAQVRSNADDDMTHYYLGLARLRRQPPDAAGAIQEMSQAVSRSPRNTTSLSGLADAYQAAGQTANAIAEQGKALELAPLSRAMRVKLIDLLIAARRYNDVLALADQAKAYPQLAGDWVWDRAAAIAHSKSGRYAEAGQRIAQAMALAQGADKPDLYRDQMDLLLAAKDFAGALKVTDQLLAGGTKEWWVYQYRGLAKAGAKDTAGALAEFDQALKGMDPKKDAAAAEAVVRSVAGGVGYQEAIKRIVGWYDAAPGFRLLAAELYRDGGDYANAAATVESLLADADRLNLSKQARVMSLRRAGEIYLNTPPKPLYEKAVGVFAKMVELVPDDVASLNNLAYLLAEEVSPPRPQEAKVYSERAYNLSRNWARGNGQFLDTHGWVLVLTGDGQNVEQGIQLLSQVVERAEPSSPLMESHYHLGEAFLRRSNPDPARAGDQFQLALGLIAKAKQAGQPVDPKLEAQVKSGVERAQQMSRAGAQ